jgi:hypothetical protein
MKIYESVRKINFLEFFFEKMFQQHIRLSYDTFCALIKVLSQSFEKKI